MSKKKFQDKETDPFVEGVSTSDADEQIYGKVSLPDSGIMRAKPTDIYQIWPDPRQPRRAIPSVVRGYWQGDPDELGEVFKTWQNFAETEANRKLDVARAIKGYEAIVSEDEKELPVYAGFANLVLLAAAIYSEGLTNPITIIQHGSQWQVETGERRWLAHHLLSLHIDKEKYKKIAAREVKYDPFRQASENHAREQFNAIEQTRQFALLVMEARSGIDGVKYDRFEDVIYAGECDRKFYKQVHNGNIHEVPDYLKPKIENAIAKSWSRLSQFRSILALTGNDAVDDAIWIAADTYNWSDRAIRDLAPAQRDWDDDLKVKYAQALQDVIETGDWDYRKLLLVREQHGESFNMLKLSKEEEPHQEEEIAPDNPSSAAQTAGETPYSEKYKQLLPPHDNPATRYVNPNRDGFGKEFAPPKPSPFGSAHVVGNDGEIGAPPMNLKGKKVRLKDGREGTIWEDKGGDKLMFLKTGATISNEVYRSAIASVMTGGLEEVNGWRVGDKVVYLRDGEKLRGTVLEVHPRIMHVLEANGETANVLYENAARVSDKMPAPNWPPSDSPKQRNNPNDKFIQDGRIKTMVAQARYLAASLECKEAEDSLALLSGLTLGDIQKVSKENHPDSVQDMLGGHYEHIANGMQKFMSEIEDILRNWALLDEAERRGE
jgi:hypothetical protein